jgi:MerR family transcriptional regulator, light-induced transcriptional regulator
MAAARQEVLRIGELSKRVGVSPELLRAWERRYGLLRPARSAGGLRLYSPADVERVALMQRHLAEGLAAAEAAALAVREAVDEEAAQTALRPAAIRDELAAALDAFDEPSAQAILDRLLALATMETLLSEVIMPYLQELGERWERGVGRPGAFRLRRPAWTAARVGAWLGPRVRPGGGAGLPAG